MKLSEYRERSSETLAQLAEKADVTIAAMSRYERGLQVPRKEIMERIFVATNGAVTPNDFFDLSSSPPATS